MSPNTTTDDIETPNEHLQIPSFITESYFEPILEKDVPNFSKIVKFKAVAATAPGENYTSIMVRVHLDVLLKDGSTTKKSYILKTTFEVSTAGTAVLKSMNLFPKEKYMYETLLPQFTRMYQDAGENVELGPRCLHIEETPERTTLVMEDLGERKFKNCDRLKGLDLPHMTRILRKLAEFHAASAVYYERNGPYPDMFTQGFFNESNRAMFVALHDHRHEIYVRAMRSWGLENVEKYIEGMADVNAFFDETIRICKAEPDEFNVLNHGDTWVNNLMFNYTDEGELDECLLVDFQVGVWGSPTNDLWYLITTSASLDVKVKEYDHFIQIYQARLAECLKLFKYEKPIPSLKDMHINMLNRGFWSVSVAGGVMTAVLCPTDKDANMDAIMNSGPEGDAIKYKMFSNSYYAKAMCQLYPFLENKGILSIPAKAKNST